MNRMQKIFLSFLIGMATPSLIGAEADTTYRTELKKLQKEPFYNIILNRHSSTFLRAVMARTANRQELHWWGELFRAQLLAQNGVVVTEKEMPALYGYLDTLCKANNIRTPTLLITKDKQLWPIVSMGKFYETNSEKYLTSSGGLLVSQDLILETSAKALEAAVAHEVALIKYNKDNVNIAFKWLVPLFVSHIMNRADLDSRPLHLRLFAPSLVAQYAIFLLPHIIIAKQFEKQADQFVCKETDNAEGLLELCTYLQKKDAKNETDYVDSYRFLQQANVGLLYYILQSCNIGLIRTGHAAYNGYKWVCLHTPLTPYQSNDARIKAAQRYVAQKQAQ